MDVSPVSLTLEFTGGEERLQTLVGLLKPYGIKEVVRSGALAIEKGSLTALKQNAKA